MLLPEFLAQLGDYMKFGAGHPRMEVKIEFQGVVDDLVIKAVYTVPESNEYPPALHIEVEPEGCRFARIPPAEVKLGESRCKHRAWNNNGRCAEMGCWNYVEKHKDDPVPELEQLTEEGAADLDKYPDAN